MILFNLQKSVIYLVLLSVVDEKMLQIKYSASGFCMIKKDQKWKSFRIIFLLICEHIRVRVKKPEIKYAFIFCSYFNFFITSYFFFHTFFHPNKRLQCNTLDCSSFSLRIANPCGDKYPSGARFYQPLF